MVEGKDVEKVCNAVAAESMVPDKVFLEKWDENEQQDISFKTKDLAKYFLCFLLLFWLNFPKMMALYPKHNIALTLLSIH